MTNTTSCKKCGEHIRWELRRAFNIDGKPHHCQPKVKVYSDEEKRELEKKMKKNHSTE